MAARNHPLLGKWRIVEMELWDSDFLDLVEPAYISFDAQGRGTFVFGAVQGGLHCRYGPDSVRFTWQGFDEMDPVSGAGDADARIEVAVAEAFAAELREVGLAAVLENTRFAVRLRPEDRDELMQRIHQLTEDMLERDDPTGESLSVYLAVHRRETGSAAKKESA